jgi:hypothetical protein
MIHRSLQVNVGNEECDWHTGCYSLNIDELFCDCLGVISITCGYFILLVSEYFVYRSHIHELSHYYRPILQDGCWGSHIHELSDYYRPILQDGCWGSHIHELSHYYRPILQDGCWGSHIHELSDYYRPILQDGCWGSHISK